jgi:hypothetical protein
VVAATTTWTTISRSEGEGRRRLFRASQKYDRTKRRWPGPSPAMTVSVRR